MSDLRTAQDAHGGAKRCARCDLVLPLADFPPNPKLRSGGSSWCRRCHAAATRTWRAAHPEAVEKSNAARRIAPYPAKPCTMCGEDFTPIRHDGIYCSPVCRHRARRARQTAA